MIYHKKNTKNVLELQNLKHYYHENTKH